MRNTQILCNQPWMGRVAKDIGLGKPVVTTETKSRINPTWTSWIDGKKKTIDDTLSIFFNVAIITTAVAATYS